MFTEETQIKELIRCECGGSVFYFDLNKLVWFSLEKNTFCPDVIWLIKFQFTEGGEKIFSYKYREDAVEAFEEIEKQLC